MTTKGQFIVFLAFRYALGRKTYVVGEVVGYLIEHWSDLSISMRQAIHTEIKDAIERDVAGMAMDVKEWRKVLMLKKTS